MNKIGTVIGFQDRFVQLEIPRSSRCRGCHACTPLNGKNSMTLFALNDCHAAIGDRVEIQIQESGELSATLLLYGIPLVLFLAAIFLFSLFLEEIPTVLLSLAVLALTYLGIHFLSRRLNRDRYLPRAVRIIS